MPWSRRRTSSSSYVDASRLPCWPVAIKLIYCAAITNGACSRAWDVPNRIFVASASADSYAVFGAIPGPRSRDGHDESEVLTQACQTTPTFAALR